MPMQLTHTLSDGLSICIELKRSAKKNIILRPHSADTVRLNVPPYLGGRQLKDWLAGNEPLLRQALSRPPQPAPETMPGHIWYRGERHTLHTHKHAHICHQPPQILLPEALWSRQKSQLCRYLAERAAETLLPRLAQHAQAMRLNPAATALSHAKTFWGVCRSRTGIRLNWRLIGAPDFVADYVCIYELCHLPHPNHGPHFWEMVHRYTPHTRDAKKWLKQHGSELFVLG
ncbi:MULTISPECIES: M48 family metallopeptidase [unclassified Neisseria]|uniref:M48 family metallopeptidase n=1 Tax=unclassified Neisseria TaxID=2623750 RepID=UPI001072B8A6|nr:MULTISPECIES: SprT family zinc-dependent metalloprotease [unclassified Neisseria]MBF0804467.1 M48 family metallopeptidase [Neisseria sp. 19428wB4_WF04]TFU40533.1 M48 family peptidase [Neisseria sp. WF04]